MLKSCKSSMVLQSRGGQKEHQSADACDTTAEGLSARRVQGDLKWNNEKNTFNTFQCVFYFKIQTFDYVFLASALI